MILNEREDRMERAVMAARQMMTAARTAPKAKGTDVVEVALVCDEDLSVLADTLWALGEETGKRGLLRDAQNIRQGLCVVLVGVHPTPMMLNCGHCGSPLCADKPARVPCAFNAIDVGIAIGSACATAADLRLDTRVMYSVGLAAQKMGILPDCAMVQGIAVSISSKSPFFDRVVPDEIVNHKRPS